MNVNRITLWRKDVRDGRTYSCVQQLNASMWISTARYNSENDGHLYTIIANMKAEVSIARAEVLTSASSKFGTEPVQRCNINKAAR